MRGARGTSAIAGAYARFTCTLSHSRRLPSHIGHAFTTTWPSIRHHSASTTMLRHLTPFLCPQSACSTGAGSCEGCHDTSPPLRRAQLTLPQAKARRQRPQPPSRLLQRARGWPCRATQQRSAVLNAGSLLATASVRCGSILESKLFHCLDLVKAYAIDASLLRKAEDFLYML